MDLNKIEEELKNGSLELADKAKLSHYLKIMLKISAEGNIGTQKRADLILMELRFRIKLKEASEDQRKNLCWSKIGGVAAVAAALFGGFDFYQKICVSTSNKTQPNIESQQSPPPSQLKAPSSATNFVPATTNQSIPVPSMSNPSNKDLNYVLPKPGLLPTDKENRSLSP